MLPIHDGIGGDESKSNFFVVLVSMSMAACMAVTIVGCLRCHKISRGSGCRQTSNGKSGDGTESNSKTAIITGNYLEMSAEDDTTSLKSIAINDGLEEHSVDVSLALHEDTHVFAPLSTSAVSLYQSDSGDGGIASMGGEEQTETETENLNLSGDLGAALTSTPFRPRSSTNTSVSCSLASLQHDGPDLMDRVSSSDMSYETLSPFYDKFLFRGHGRNGGHLVSAQNVVISSHPLDTHGFFSNVRLADLRLHGGGKVLVAARLLRLPASTPERARAALHSSAESMMQLRHINILNTIGIMKPHDDVPFSLFTELIRCPTFQDHLHALTKPVVELPAHNIIHLLLQIAKGMEHLESKGVIHRQLALRNIMFVSPELVKITGFGVDSAGDGHFNSMLHYAPECLDKKKFSSSSDVWAFACLARQAICYDRENLYHVTSHHVPGINRAKSAKSSPSGSEKGSPTVAKGTAFKSPAELLNHLRGGSRPKKPKTCPESLWALLQRCWKLAPGQRPTFHAVVRESGWIDSSMAK